MTALLVATVVTGLAAAPHPSAAQALAPAVPYAAGQRLFARNTCTPVYAAASDRSRLLTQLLQGTDVKSLGDGGSGFTRVSFWSGLEGYIRSDALTSTMPGNAYDDDTCAYPGLPNADGNPLSINHGPFPLTARGFVNRSATAYGLPDEQSNALAGLPDGLPLTIMAWASDTRGRPWYQVGTPKGTGWVWSGNVKLDTPNPATRQVNGKPIWAPIAGKGMYFTNYLPHHSDAQAVVQAAKRAGVTHIYAEVAITRYGMYGQNSLDRLLPVAHKAGITVVAWIYTTLEDVGRDVRMTQQVANYRTPTGDKVDGLIMDIEEITDSGSVYTYGQLARAVLGPDMLFVASVFHPFARPGYPYAAIAASFNVVAPMDYWHSRENRGYSASDVRSFVSTSIQTIRAAMRAGGMTPLPVEETGQFWDMYTANEVGLANAPTAEEITADMQTAKDLGAIGVAFYQWQSTTQEEWDTLSGFKW